MALDNGFPRNNRIVELETSYLQVLSWNAIFHNLIPDNLITGEDYTSNYKERQVGAELCEAKHSLS